MTAVISAHDLTAGYGQLAAVRGLNLQVGPGEVLALLGANGAGKTTALLALVGELKPLSGEVRWQGKTTTAHLHHRAKHGLAFVPEDKSVISGLSGRDNLKLARGSQTAALQAFPQLAGLLNRQGGLLSGGEQQMLTVGRAFGQSPKALIVDELSLGLAPIIADRVGTAIRDFAQTGVAVIVVEQNLQRALRLSDRFVLLKRGEIAYTGLSAEHRHDSSQLRHHYLGAPLAADAGELRDPLRHHGPE
jgi:branched-chain amino acid transport system ATP-binding protein